MSGTTIGIIFVIGFIVILGLGFLAKKYAGESGKDDFKIKRSIG